MNQTDWAKAKESRLRMGMIDFFRKRISAEDYERIRNETYEGEAATTIS